MVIMTSLFYFFLLDAGGIGMGGSDNHQKGGATFIYSLTKKFSYISGLTQNRVQKGQAVAEPPND